MSRSVTGTRADPASSNGSRSLLRYLEWLALIIILVTLAQRASLISRQTEVEWADGAAYAIVAENIISGNGIRDWYGVHTLWPPLYPTLMGITSLITVDVETAGRVTSLAMGAMVVLLSWLIGRQLFGRPAATWTALMVAFHPDLAVASIGVQSETTYLSMAMAAVWVAIGALDPPRPWRLMIAGLLIGCAYLTRPEAIGLLGVIPLVLALVAFRGASPKRVAYGVATLFLGFAVMATPYLLFLRVHTGQWQLSGKARHNLAVTDPRLGSSMAEKYYGLSPDGEHVGLERVSAKDVIDYWSTRPAAFAERYVRLTFKEYFELLPGAIQPAFLILAGVGLAQRRWRYQWAGKLVVLGALFPFFVYPITHLEPRYMIPLVPFILLWSGNGAALVLDGIGATGRPRTRLWAQAIATTVLSVLLIGQYAYFLRGPYRAGRGEKAAGQWIMQDFGVGARIMERTHVAAYHGRGIPVDLPYAPLPTVLSYAEKHGADYLVIGEGRHHQDLQPLLRGDGEIPGLRHLHTLERAPQSGIRNKIVIFKIESPPSLQTD